MKHESVFDIAQGILSGKLSRRQALARAGAIGVGASALAMAVNSPLAVNYAAAQASGDLVVAAGGDIDTTDPHISQLLVFNNMMRFTVFDGLVKYGEDMGYVGNLAESWENPDDKTYVFTLREGLTYHDGTPVTAAHVESSFQRIADQDTIWSSRVANITSYQVIDDLTISISLSEVQADFLDGLVPLSIISPDAAESIDSTPVGTGPFKFVEWIPNDHISLEANESYHEEGVPGVATLRFNIIPEPQVAITNLQSGDIGAVMSVPVPQAVALEGNGDVSVVNVPTSSIPVFEMLGKNNELIRGNANVRQALAYALDKNAVQQTAYAGGGLPKWTFVGSTSWAYKDIPGYDYDLDKASQMLADEGVENLEFTCLSIQGYPEGEQAATIWQAGLSEIGVTMNVELQELGVWLDNYLNHTYDVIWNVFPGFADPNYFVSIGLDPHFADGWTNQEAADVAAAANATLDQDERTELYGQLQQMFVDDLPILVIQEAPAASVTATNVSGWTINPLSWVLMDDVKVE